MSKYCASFNCQTQRLSQSWSAPPRSAWKLPTSKLRPRPRQLCASSITSAQRAPMQLRRTWSANAPLRLTGDSAARIYLHTLCDVVIHTALLLGNTAAMNVFRNVLATEISSRHQIIYGSPPGAAVRHRKRSAAAFSEPLQERFAAPGALMPKW